MPDGEDWLMAPVVDGLCRYESLLDGTLDMVDIQRMHNAMAVRAVNQRRYDERTRRGNT